jgi:hypothetical protein
VESPLCLPIGRKHGLAWTTGTQPRTNGWILENPGSAGFDRPSLFLFFEWIADVNHPDSESTSSFQDFTTFVAQPRTLLMMKGDYGSIGSLCLKPVAFVHLVFSNSTLVLLTMLKSKAHSRGESYAGASFRAA